MTKIDKQIERALKEAIKQNKINKTIVPTPIVSDDNKQYSDYGYDKKYRKYTNKFYDTIINSVPSNNLAILKKNIKDVKIEEIENNTLYNYTWWNNTIQIVNDDYFINLFPKDRRIYKKELKQFWEFYLYKALFYMASTTTSDTRLFQGFSQAPKILPRFNSTGDGLQSMYTNILVEKYFKIKSLNSNIEYVIINILNMIVGEEKMLELYFKADLFGFIEELKNYNSEKKIVQFLDNIDFIFSSDIKNQGTIEKFYYDLSLKYIGTFLMETVTKKNLLLLNNNDDEKTFDLLFETILELENVLESVKLINDQQKYKIISKAFGISVGDVKTKIKSKEINK